MAFRVALSSSVDDDLRKLARRNREMYRRVRKRLDELAVDPRALSEGKLEPPFQDQLKTRVGDFRIRYRVDEAAQLVDVVGIDDRKNVYR